MINVGLMTTLYNVVAHNLNEARKARDGKKKGTTQKEHEKLKVGDNILVRVPTKVQGLLYNRTHRKEPSRD